MHYVLNSSSTVKLLLLVLAACSIGFSQCWLTLRRRSWMSWGRGRQKPGCKASLVCGWWMCIFSPHAAHFWRCVPSCLLSAPICGRLGWMYCCLRDVGFLSTCSFYCCGFFSSKNHWGFQVSSVAGCLCKYNPILPNTRSCRRYVQISGVPRWVRLIAAALWWYSTFALQCDWKP